VCVCVYRWFMAFLYAHACIKNIKAMVLTLSATDANSGMCVYEVSRKAYIIIVHFFFPPLDVRRFERNEDVRRLYYNVFVWFTLEFHEKEQCSIIVYFCIMTRTRANVYIEAFYELCGYSLTRKIRIALLYAKKLSFALVTALIITDNICTVLCFYFKIQTSPTYCLNTYNICIE